MLPSVISKQPRWMFVEISTQQTTFFHDKLAKDASSGEEMNNLHDSALEMITTDKDGRTYNKMNEYLCASTASWVTQPPASPSNSCATWVNPAPGFSLQLPHPS
jgi:hypothetical protein